jgi:hypothetical protein
MSAETAQETQETVTPPEKDNGSEGVRVQTRSGREIELPSRFFNVIFGFCGNVIFLFLLLTTGLSREL